MFSTSILAQSSAASTIIFPGAATLSAASGGAVLALPAPLAGASVAEGFDESLSGADGGVTVNA